MKIIILFILIGNFLFAQSVINAIEAPLNASGLAWDGNYLWCGAYGINGDTIFKLDPDNGTILKRIRWMQSADSYGLTFDQGDLWVNDHISGTDSIFRIDTITGARVHAIPAHKEYMAGLANNGTQLWCCVYYDPNGRAYYIDKTDGGVLDSIDIPELPQPWGAAWDGQYLWVCNDGNYGGTHTIYKIDVSAQQIVDSLDSPGNRPWGLTWDGSYLWVIARGPSSTGFVAYQIDLQGGGTPENKVSVYTKANHWEVIIYPRISRSSFNIVYGKSMVNNIKIYDATGRLVRQWDYPAIRLSDQIIWHADDEQNRSVAQGVYFIKIKGENHSQTEKVVFIR